MNRFLKASAMFFSLVLICSVGAAAAAPPDPADSVIMESKFTVNPTIGACNSGIFRVRVYVTNKDSLTNVTIPLEEKTINGNAYGIISRPTVCGNARTSPVVFNFLYPVAPGSGTPRLATRIPSFAGYHSDSPDTFMGTFTFSDPTDDDTKLPPNSPRALLLEIKFDSVTGVGCFQLDSSKVLSNTLQFVNVGGTTIFVNFVSSIDTVDTHVGLGAHDINRGLIPKEYSLAQNYPNPFNANTQITFALPKSGNTILEIYNVLGQKVSTLFNEYMSAGTKTVNWDGRDDQGTGVPSGIYFYRLTSKNGPDQFIQTKKMMVIK